MPRNNVAQARQRAGYSQQALAEKVGVRRLTILRIEKGLHQPSVTVALAIARELGETVEALFSPATLGALTLEELRTLRWRDVDLQAGRVMLDHRQVALSAALRAELLALRTVDGGER
jgi:putative transcriptional regulator